MAGSTVSTTGRLIRKADQEYIGDHIASKARKMAPPKNLLGWFLEAFRAEMPADLHTSGVWREWVTQDHRHTGGGSLLGAPRYADTFRRFLEERPGQTETAEYEGHKDLATHYAFPLRAALARLAGRGPDTEESPFMARCLYRTALRDGDWVAACASMGIPEPVRKVYIEAALYRLWTRFEIEPSPYSLREATRVA